jgi:hypothetical protein
LRSTKLTNNKGSRVHQHSIQKHHLKDNTKLEDKKESTTVMKMSITAGNEEILVIYLKRSRSISDPSYKEIA